ncbi:MAG: helix-turn-helix domain-containing protein [Clostridiales bacterium]|nr:helix-turn-helix domain-containing protein [Clostridiales bacterium]
MKNIFTLANYLAENIEKENIISELFDLFNVDCMKRCQLNPSELDRLIRKFNEGNDCDISVLADIITFIKGEQKSIENKENELIRTIQSHIDKTFMQDISIEKIADDLHMSYYYMCHVFKNKLKITINTYRTKKRLEQAMRLLVQSDNRITDIASLCGYNNISYFTETFTKNIGISPTAFREQYAGVCFHQFYDYDDMLQATQMECLRFLSKDIKKIKQDIQSVHIRVPDNDFKFLHEAAIIEYHNVLYASWYQCPEKELRGYTPICGKRSYDGGKTWSDLEIICEDKSEKILYCPPVYGICDDRLYMLVNQMVAPDHIHSLDLYVLNTETCKFELLWSRPVPFKLNTNVVTLPNGKLMLPGRIAELDGFPNTPAVLISDSGKIDTQWRLVKIADDGNLPCGTKLVHPEISVICAEDILYMFCRNDKRKVPLVYISNDYGETWSDVCAHDIPYVSTKVYCGTLSDGRHYIICNTDKPNRSKLSVYFTADQSIKLSKQLEIFDTDDYPWRGAMHYPAACEYEGYLYIIATKGYENAARGAELFKINLKEI